MVVAGKDYINTCRHIHMLVKYFLLDMQRFVERIQSRMAEWAADLEWTCRSACAVHVG